MKTQEQMQELFDKVSVHLLKQNNQSLRTGGCAYRGRDGMSCAIGCLIPDSEYHDSMEGTGFGDRPELLRSKNPYLYNFLRELGAFNGVDLSNCGKMLADLQSMHDCARPPQWANDLTSLARKFELNTNAMDAYLASKKGAS